MVVKYVECVELVKIRLELEWFLNVFVMSFGADLGSLGSWRCRLLWRSR